MNEDYVNSKVLAEKFMYPVLRSMNWSCDVVKKPKITNLITQNFPVGKYQILFVSNCNCNRVDLFNYKQNNRNSLENARQLLVIKLSLFKNTKKFIREYEIYVMKCCRGVHNECIKEKFVIQNVSNNKIN